MAEIEDDEESEGSSAELFFSAGERVDVKDVEGPLEDALISAEQVRFQGDSLYHRLNSSSAPSFVAAWRLQVQLLRAYDVLLAENNAVIEERKRTLNSGLASGGS